MPRISRNVVAARWRHFFPKAASFSLNVPSFKSVIDSTGKPVVEQKTSFAYVAPAPVDGDYTYYQLDVTANIVDVNNVSVSFNDIVQENGDVILYFDEELVAVYGPKTWFYDADNNRIVFQRVESTGVNRAPAEGTNVVIEIVQQGAGSKYTRIKMKREWLIQGANPIDSTLVNPDGTGTNGFQGGYRCALKLISRASHGHVRISDDKLAFEYRPDMGYTGTDAFSYRMVNSMGQESQAYRIDITVGTPKL